MNYRSLHTQTIKDPSKNEILLLEGLRASNEPSFRKLYQDYSLALSGIIAMIVRNKEEAEDVLQDTFIKILKNLYLYDPGKSRLFTWMARIARNKALDHIRTASAKNNIKNVDLRNIEEGRNKYLHAISYNIETIGIKYLTAILTPSQKQVIDLIYFHGYTQVEVAEELNMPLGTVKTRIRTGILSLRELFAEE